MAEIPFFQFYPGDYLAKTQHLTTIEHGAYLLLIMAAWGRKDCGLPDDDQFLARTVGLSTRKWKVLRPIIMEFWLVDDGYIYNARLLKDHKALQKRSQTFSESGAKGAAVKKAKSLKTNKMNGSHASISGKPPLSILEPELEPDKKDITASNDAGLITESMVLEALTKYTSLAENLGLPGVRGFSDTRKKKMRLRLKEHGVDGWQEALDNVEGSSFLRGEGGGDRPWKVNLDWLLEPKNILKVLEENYNQESAQQSFGSPDSWPGISD